MFKKVLLFFIGLPLFGMLNALHAQSCTNNRYLDPVFALSTTENITFAEVDALVYPPWISENLTVNDNLRLDLYEPEGDTLSKRPLIIMAFGGGFLLGWKRYPPLVDFCEAMARRGYVVASIDYRLGFNILDIDSAIRAIYRGGQDMIGAIRYFKGNAGTYRIDPNLIFVGGDSAGGFNSVHAAYVEESERASSPLLQPTYAFSGPFGANWPDLGCITCSGDNGSFNYAGSSKPAGVINLWGAIGDTSWINSTMDQPMISFHGANDMIVDPGEGAPFGADAFFPGLFGSIPLHQRLDNLGIFNELHLLEGFGHEPWINNTQALYIQENSAAFLYEIIKPQELPVIAGESVPIYQSAYSYSVAFSSGSTYCWEVTGGVLVSPQTDSHIVEVYWNAVGPTALRVREINCNGAEGDWAELNVEVVPCVPPDIDGFYIDNCFAPPVLLGWDPVSGAVEYEFMGRRAGRINPDISTVVTSPGLTFNGSVPNGFNVEYRFRSRCNNGAWSAWTPLNPYTIQCENNGAAIKVHDDFEGVDLAPLFQTTHIYPNPAAEVLHLEFYSERAETAVVEVVDMLGSNVYRDQLHAPSGWQTTVLDLSDIAPGTYLLKLQQRSGTIVKQFVKF